MANVIIYCIVSSTLQIVSLTGAVYFCNVGDPCAESNAQALYQSYARSENCKQDPLHILCDRYITPQWYRVDDPMLTECPDLQSCGALYPVWLNGTLPASTDGIVDRKACSVGFDSCCFRTYDIQIKHCGSFYAFCLGALDTCPERYCFGKIGTCDFPTTSLPETTPFLEDEAEDDPDVVLVLTISIFVILVVILIPLMIWTVKLSIKRNANIGNIASSQKSDAIVNDTWGQRMPPPYSE